LARDSPEIYAGLTVWGGHRWSEATSKVFDLVAEFAEHESLSRPYSQ
jgi:hypothetical protein